MMCLQAVLSLYIVLLCTLLPPAVDAFSSAASRVRVLPATVATPSTLRSSKGDGDDRDAKLLWAEEVQWVDLSAAQMDDSPTSRPLPLFVLGTPAFPQGESYLNVFEMRYRTLMFDCSKGDDMFGWIYSDESGRIASMGTLCKITSRKLEDDGRQLVTFKGVSRFQVRKVLKTLPYLLAEVETDMPDAPADEAEAARLEAEVYSSLTIFMKLMRMQPRYRDLTVPLQLKESRALRFGNESPQEAALRRTRFSFALANMIRLVYSDEAQLILQTPSIIKRLSAQKRILSTANDNLAETLIKEGLITAELLDMIKTSALTQPNADAEFMPADPVPEATETKDEWDLSNIE